MAALLFGLTAVRRIDESTKQPKAGLAAFRKILPIGLSARPDPSRRRSVRID